MSPVVYGVGLALIAIAAGNAIILSVEALGAISLPGCGIGSACAAAAASAWGKVPGIDWPVSFLGAAYFLGLLLAWFRSREGLSPVLRNVIRLGALVSAVFLGAILSGGYFCPYCIAVQAANLLLWLIVEKAPASTSIAPRPIIGAVVVFAVVSVTLGVIEKRARQQFAADQEQKRAGSVEEIARVSTQGGTSLEPEVRVSPAVSPTGTGETTSQPPPVVEGPKGPGFTGRYRWGPAAAPIRIVMFTDYQCPDCRRIEQDIRRMMNERTDVSLSVKHFPMCAACNPAFEGNNFHPNACWAARAAEAAGILRGDEGFWQMHHWLFDEKGEFSDADLPPSLAALGYDSQQFIRVMMSDQTLANVKADIDEANTLGLHYTPMIFFNGVELLGVFAHDAVPRTVLDLAAKNLPPGTCEQDHPQPAAAKYISDWEAQGVRQLPDPSPDWSRGNPAAPLRVDLWGDYLEPNTARAHRRIAELLAGRTDAVYYFWRYPANVACNPHIPQEKDLFPLGCRAAQAVVAARILGGPDAYWRMTELILADQQGFSEAKLPDYAAQAGLPWESFRTALDAPEVEARIREDLDYAKQRLAIKSIPMVFVNRRHIPRWDLPGHDILQQIIEKAGTMEQP